MRIIRFALYVWSQIAKIMMIIALIIFSLIVIGTAAVNNDPSIFAGLVIFWIVLATIIWVYTKWKEFLKYEAEKLSSTTTRLKD